jgi:hypothetical protein
LLLEALDSKTRGIDYLDGAILELFQGEVLNYVNCINVNYQSSRIEKFTEVQINVKGMKNIYNSLDHYIQVKSLSDFNGRKKYLMGIINMKLANMANKQPQKEFSSRSYLLF